LKFLLNKKIIAFIISLQEAFIAVIPFIIFSALLALLNIFDSYFHISFISHKTLTGFTKASLSFLSVIATLTISYFIAKRIKTSEIISIILSLSVFSSILYYEHPHFPFILPTGFTVATLYSAIISPVFLKIFYKKFSLKINLTDPNYHIYKYFNYIFVFLIAYVFVMVVYIAVDYVMDFIIDKYNPLHINLPEIYILAIRDFLVQIFWFAGIHGEHMVNALFGKEILDKVMFDNLTYGEFHRLFINIGGAGIGLSLLVALLLKAKNETVETVARLSVPFVFFNIDDIIIFLIVVFNKFLFIPFIFLPLLNLTLGYFFVTFMNIHFTDYYVVWSTPVFLDGFLKTNSVIVPFFQLFLVILDTFVYLYFLDRYFKIQSLENKRKILRDSLGIHEEIMAKKDIKAFMANQEIIEANTKLNEIINSLNEDNMFVYYQPKVNIKKNRVKKFEALIRYYENGKLTGPYFLSIIEKAGLAPIIDIWVCKQVKKDLHKFKEIDASVSVNLHPDTLKSFDAISKVLDIFDGEKVVFEIIERSFVNNEATTNVERIKQHGFDISIDDYGVGYSSLETLIRQNVSELKIDKSIIDEIETKKGFIVCKNTIHLCKELNISTVAEGVETKPQLEAVKKLNVDLVQGFVFAKALPVDKAVEFAKTFNLDDF